MAETLVKNQFCRACGMDIRPRALFCYNCGSSVAPKIPLLENQKTSEDDLFDAAVAEGKETSDLKTEVINEKIVETNGKKDSAQEKPPLQSADKLRRKPKTVQRKRIEVTWEEPEGAPNVWFILVALLLTVFAFGIWLLASYLE